MSSDEEAIDNDNHHGTELEHDEDAVEEDEVNLLYIFMYKFIVKTWLYLITNPKFTDR